MGKDSSSRSGSVKLPSDIFSNITLHFCLNSRNKHMLPFICAFPKHVYNAPASSFLQLYTLNASKMPGTFHRWTCEMTQRNPVCRVSGEDVERQPWVDFCTPGCEEGGQPAPLQPEGWEFARDTPCGESCRKLNYIHGSSVRLVQVHLQAWNGGFYPKTHLNCETRYICKVNFYIWKISNWLLGNLNPEEPSLSLTSPVKQHKC